MASAGMKRHIALAAAGSDGSSPTPRLAVRRAGRADRSSIESLEWDEKWAQNIYGFSKLEPLLEHAALSLVAVDELGAVQGFAVFDGQPTETLLRGKPWRGWLRNCSPLLGPAPLSIATVLFQTRLVCARPALEHVEMALLTWLFASVPDLERVFHVARCQLSDVHGLEEIGFRPISSLNNPELVLEADRRRFVPRLATRPARLEDHDDLRPMFDVDEERLKEKFGEYFLAEVIADERESSYSAVVEVDKLAVGLMSVTTEVDLDTLNANFELAPFHGLRKPDPDDVTGFRVKLSEEVLGVRPSALRSREFSEKQMASDSAKSINEGREEKETGAETDQEAADGKQSTTGADAKVSQIAATKRETSADVATAASGSSIRSIVGVSETTDEPPVEREVPMLEQLWGPAIFEPGFGLPEVDEAPIPNDTEPDDTRPVLELIWGFPVSADGTVTRQVSCVHPGVGAEPATGPTPEPRPVPEYHGEPNAAAVTLFCIRDEYACRSIDLLPAVLDRMRDVDYLVMTVPADAPETPLMELFTRVPHRATSTFPDQLFVFHRASLVTDFTVTSAKSADLGAIRTLVKHTESAESLMLTVREMFLSGTAHSSVLVVRCQDQVVGVIVLKPEMEVEYLRSHFEIEEYVTCEHHDNGFGHLYHMVLNPIFRRFARVVLGEVMRLTGLSVLLYPLFPPGSEDVEGHSLASSLEALSPVTWRRQIQYPLSHGSLGVNIPKPHILQHRDPLALQLASRSTVLRRRRRVNSRIVVVGGGDAGLAILERLAFSRQLLFTNVTLVDPHGFPDGGGDELAAAMRTSTEEFTPERLGTMWLHVWVNLVRGVMVAIDRKHKLIRVAEVGDIPYDHLLLTCGLQYQLPTRLVPRPSRPFSDRRPLHPPVLLPEAPENVFRVNSQYDAERALDYVRAYCLERNENVIVYGGYLETLTCLETLLRLPVPPHRLVLVLPPLDDLGGCTQLSHDPEVDKGVFFRLRAAENGIRILEGYTLVCWDIKYNNRVYRIQLRGGELLTGERHLSCCGLFVYDHRGVELVTFKALNDASLVFDGRLVIDHQFGTNDPDIKAVGTMTKYSRRYYADRFDHFEYSSREVGHALGDQILRLYGADTQQTKRLTTKDRRRSSLAGVPLPPEFQQPRVTRARLPGGWNYLHVVAPEPLADQKPPWVLTTGDPVYLSATGYMRIEISEYRVVQKITCFSKNDIETDNFIALHGLHEVLLNNMVARYEEGLITDLYTYFRDPWAMLVFHDRFSVLLEDIRRAVQRCLCRDGKLTLEEKIVDDLCRYSELSQPELIKILEDFRRGGVDKMVERWILQYLANNQYHLPMYAREGTAESLKISRDGVVESVNNALSVSRYGSVNW
ncbi:cilia- and flagella-associated protein 61-like isoform X1 [Amphibalanus amphitrite]|uniref:cilia- and flagella-associated protein 61-like isoform X1 n=1 Tax=Amphibalanus amphitrite TaxID=1232801 RepID=UPI001C91459B|nr:cilia- and flagella-associated protein 61-like isoform X1 [Amphibalanus amphitrite]